MTRILPGLLLLLFLLPAAPASAAPEVGIADDRVLLPGGALADEAVAEWKALGVDNVRILAHWGQIAPDVSGRSVPAGFDQDNPNDPRYQWYYLDQAIARVTNAGMTVTLSVTGPGPVWTSSVPRKGMRQYKPKASRYAAFAKAVALRYANRVDRYLLWNEPNLGKWLAPQNSCKRGRCKPYAPHLYRSLATAAYKSIDAADPTSEIVIGALGPRGKRRVRWNSTMAPMVFLRELGCRTSSFRKMRGGFCRRFKPAPLDGFAVHPYSFRAPEVPNPGRDDVSIAQLPNLIRTLDRLKRKRALKSKRRIDVFIDEHGYQTRPEDPFAGISRGTQNTYLQRAAYHAWRSRRVKLFTQYLWRDEPNRQNWQSGLRTTDGRAKTSVRYFDTPFVVDAARRRMWGQIRPGGRQWVRIEYKKRGTRKWRRLKSKRTDSRGYFSIRRKASSRNYYRFRVGRTASKAVRG